MEKMVLGLVVETTGRKDGIILMPPMVVMVVMVVTAAMAVMVAILRSIIVIWQI